MLPNQGEFLWINIFITGTERSISTLIPHPCMQDEGTKSENLHIYLHTCTLCMTSQPQLSSAWEDITSFCFLAFVSKLTLYHHPLQIVRHQPELNDLPWSLRYFQVMLFNTLFLPLPGPPPIFFHFSTSHLLFNKICTVDFSIWSCLHLSSGRVTSCNGITAGITGLIYISSCPTMPSTPWLHFQVILPVSPVLLFPWLPLVTLS